MLNACTEEIDDPDAAVAELLEQLDLKNRLLKNAVGIIACHLEYIETGVIKALGEKLPFDIVGCTSMANSTADKCGQELLSLTVLTSDDTRFSTVISRKMKTEDYHDPIAEAFKEVSQASGEKPDLILAYMPLMLTLGGGLLFNELNEACGGVPIFGSFACDHTLDFQQNMVIRNGEAYKDCLALILISGNIHPKFLVTVIPEKNIQKQHAVITESDGYVLKKVNGLPLLEYLAGLGLTRGNNNIEVNGTIPFLIDLNDGTPPVAQAIYQITPEGYAVCSNYMPVDSTLAIGSVDYDGIMETTEITVKKALENEDINGILFHPCLTRNMMLGPNADDEMLKIIELLEGKVPYQICYAGGEICPAIDKDNKPVNHFHNFTFTLCIL
jgi:hypothetical protein